MTVASLSKTWVIENIDSIVNSYIRKWLEVPVSGTLSNVYLSRNKFGQNIIPPSIKFTQCQTVHRNALKSSPNDNMKELWTSTSNHTNVQYDSYKSTKEVLKSFHLTQEDKLNRLTCQGSFLSNVSKFSLLPLNALWSTSQSKLPKNIFNFTIRYINNTLPSRKNLCKWGIGSSSDCSFCLRPESLLQLVADCQHYLERFTWRHDSVLNFLAKNLQSVNGCKLFLDLPGFENPSVITGDEQHPDLLLSTPNNNLYIVELTVGFETNLTNNAIRKKSKYKDFVRKQKENSGTVKFINLSVSALGIFDKECHTFLDMLNDLDLDKKYQNSYIRNIINIAIRTTYYIFCCRNKICNVCIC